MNTPTHPTEPHETLNPRQQMIAAILRRMETAVDAVAYCQSLDATHPDYGAYVVDNRGEEHGLASADHTATGSYLPSLVLLVFHPLSPRFGDSGLLGRLHAALDFVLACQSEEGLIDLPKVNFRSPPDTGFAVQFFGEAYRWLVACESDAEGKSDVCGKLALFLQAAGDGINGRGFITPNHRWVSISALALVGELFPEKRPFYADYIEKTLAETIDVNGDGEFSERSSAVYSAVNNRCLRLLARGLGRPEFLDAVRANLRFSLLLTQPDGSIVTSVSTRQDKDARHFATMLAESYLDLAMRDKNGEWMAEGLRLAGLQGRNMTSHDDIGGLAFSLIALEDHAGEPMPSEQQSPIRWEKHLQHSGLWRIRSGRFASLSAVGQNNIVSVDWGKLRLLQTRFFVPYFGREFVISGMVPQKDGMQLIESHPERAPGWFLPLGRPVPYPSHAEYYEIIKTREMWELPRLDISIVLRKTSGGLDLHLQTKDGLPDMPCVLMAEFDTGGFWHTTDSILSVKNASTVFHCGGEAIYRVGGDAVRLRANTEKTTWGLHLAANAERFCVLFNFTTPLKAVVSLEFGTYNIADRKFVSSKVMEGLPGTV